MVRDAGRGAALLAGLSLIVTTWAGLTAVVAGRLSGPSLVVAFSVTALVLCSATSVTALRRVRERRLERGDVLRAAGAGFLGIFLAPFLVLTNRYSDAPPGTELIFFTTACWGAIAVVPLAVAWWRRGERGRAWATVVGAAAAVVGAAGILGNWERPSSFSPLVRFAAEEVWMLAAGVAFVAGVLLMRSAAQRIGPVSLPIGALAAVAAALVAWLGSGQPLATVARLAEMSTTVSLWAVAGAVTWLALTARPAASAPALSASALFLPPVLLPVLTVLERAVGVAGPEPLVWDGIIGGTLLVAAGIVRILVWRPGQSGIFRERRPTVAAALAAGLLVVAGVSLALPALQAEVTGNRATGSLSLAWTMPGWESAAGLAAFCLAALLLVTLADRSVMAAAAALASVPAYWLLARTPTHVLTRWLSADVQQDYGTEYASISFRALAAWPARVAVVGAGVGLALVLAGRLLSRRSGRGMPKDSVEV